MKKKSPLLNRRDFIKTSLAGGLAMALSPTGWPEAIETAPRVEPGGTNIWVIHGTDKKALMRRALETIFANGGFGERVTSLTLKVNAAWARLPEEGANTHPELVGAFLGGCREAGVTRLTIPENPCANPRFAFTRSGIEEAAKRHGAELMDLQARGAPFADYEIPGGRSLQKARVARPFVEREALVNMPVAKHHNGAVLTMAMKNWMGAVEDRGFWHRHDLHQCIADFSTFIRPDWTIIDATRIMLDRGPQGPSENMKTPDLLIVSRDQVAADAYTCCTLFHDGIGRVKYLDLAREMNLGETDLARMTIHRLEA